MLRRSLSLSVLLFSLCAVAAAILLFSMSAFGQSREPFDLGQTSGNTFESPFFSFRFEFPKGWSALDDKVRVAENTKRYKDALAQVEKNNEAAPKDQRTDSDVPVPANLLVAAKVPLTMGDEKPLPRIVIKATKRGIMMMKADDAAKKYIFVHRPKVLKKSEEVVISGHKFVRTDFQNPDSFFSQFATVRGNYIIEFDFYSSDEKDLPDLVKTMDSVQFKDE
jgi:hypothetical protein